MGGEEATIEEVPYQVQLVLNGTFQCGGSIIAPRWILTAAHCINSRDVRIDLLQVRTGTSIRNDGGSLHNAVHKIVHEKYVNNWGFDIALLKVTISIFSISRTIDCKNDNPSFAIYSVG